MLPGERDESSRHESLESSQRLAAEAQPEHLVYDPVFSLSLPLLVEKILRSFSFPVLEPPVREGRTRVYWTSVRCDIQLF